MKYRSRLLSMFLLAACFISVATNIRHSFDSMNCFDGLGTECISRDRNLPEGLGFGKSSNKNESPGLYAYAYLLGNYHSDNQMSRNYLYSIMVSAFLLRKLGAVNDMILYVIMDYKESNDIALPLPKLRTLQRLGVQIQYLPRDPHLNYYRMQLQKFRILGLTKYRKVLFLDADVMPMVNLDFLFEYADQDSDHQVFEPNFVVNGLQSPANGGFFLLTPHNGDLEAVNQLIHERESAEFDPAAGWGHVGPTDWSSETNNGTLWDFNGAWSDQGLLYYWIRYVQKSVSILQKDGRIENWEVLDDEDGGPAELVERIHPHAIQLPNPVYCWSRCTTFWSMFVHFTARTKPWNVGCPATKLTYLTVFQSPVHFWCRTLRELNESMQAGIDLEDVRDPDRKPPKGQITDLLAM